MNIANKIIAAFGDITHIHSKSLHSIYIIDARHCHLIPAIISINGILCLRNEKKRLPVLRCVIGRIGSQNS